MKRKIVEVKWFDAQTSTYAMTGKEIKEELEPLESLSVGYLIEDDKNKKYIVLGFLDFGEDLIKHHQVIPRGIIKKINVIRDGK